MDSDFVILPDGRWVFEPPTGFDRQVLTYECEICCHLGATIRTGSDAFLGAVCDACYAAVMHQGCECHE